MKKMCFPRNVFMNTQIFESNELYTAMEVAKKLKFKTARTAKKFMQEHGITYYKDTGIGRGKGLRWLGEDLNRMFKPQIKSTRTNQDAEKKHGNWRDMILN